MIRSSITDKKLIDIETTTKSRNTVLNVNNLQKKYQGFNSSPSLKQAFPLFRTVQSTNNTRRFQDHAIRANI